MTPQRKLITWAVVVLALGLVTAECVSSSPPSNATEVSHDLLPRGSKDFSGQGVRVRLGRLTRGDCFEAPSSDNTWTVRSNIAPHPIKYQFSFDIIWCENSSSTTIWSLPQNQCERNAGFYNYDGCDKDRGALHFARLRVVDTWHFHVGAGVARIDRDPHATIYLHPNGYYDGTVWAQ